MKVQIKLAIKTLDFKNNEIQISELNLRTFHVP